jgi:hypothetical protein
VIFAITGVWVTKVPVAVTNGKPYCHEIAERVSGIPAVFAVKVMTLLEVAAVAPTTEVDALIAIARLLATVEELDPLGVEVLNTVNPLTTETKVPVAEDEG